ncbi:heat shock factor 2-binding protein-like [Piliocolobus tephrosceles]|uniref:heat shock factor 2-binding protein-like n=1 Tax=Piliocolobus tephrosceles TaxID=591936 RepID=UPI000E6B074B|nr:heat shock factor 2-binding protein-like [Piliocolobus tephrosceles]
MWAGFVLCLDLGLRGALSAVLALSCMWRAQSLLSVAVSPLLPRDPGVSIRLDTWSDLLEVLLKGMAEGPEFKVVLHLELMLMSLYNVSINLKGLKYISESPGFIPLLWWLLSDPDAEVCLHVLRLVQSVVLEPEVFSKSASEFRSSLPLQRILAMSKSRNPRLQTAAQELLEDLRTLQHNV